VALCLQCVTVSQPLVHAQFSIVAGLDDYRRQHGDGSSCREDVGGSRQSGSDAAPALATVSSDVEDAAMQCRHGTAAAETARCVASDCCIIVAITGTHGRLCVSLYRDAVPSL
jgi:hypothetical protein